MLNSLIHHHDEIMEILCVSFAWSFSSSSSSFFFIFFIFFFLVSNFLRIELNIGSLCIGSEMHSSTLNPVGWLCDPPNENDQFV